MYNLSSHTIQINGWIALSKVEDDFSHSLAIHDYHCDLIEYELKIDTEKTHPDIVLTSISENHSIVVDCKAKTLNTDQHRRYKQLEQKPDILFSNSGMKSKLDSTQFELEVCYSSLTDISNHELIQQTDTPFVHFEHSPSSGVAIWNLLEFNSSTVSSTFPVNVDRGKELTTEYYPFDIEQRKDNKQFVSTIIQALLSTAMNQDTIESEVVLKEAHPHWQKIGEEKQSRFIRETNKIFRKLEQQQLKNFIEKIANKQNKWKVHHTTASAVQDRLEGTSFVEEIAKVLDQKTLGQSGS